MINKHIIGQPQERNLLPSHYANLASVLLIFKEQVLKTPNKIAVTYENSDLTYKELDRKSDALASYLVKIEPRKNAAIVVYLPRCLDMIICIIGILKANKTYVPIEVDRSVNHALNVLDDVNAHCVLTLKDLFPNNLAKVKTIYLDQSTYKFEKIKKINSISNTYKSGDLAYILYTSGSTGKQNGVLVKHENLLSSTLARIIYYKKPVKNFLLVSSYGFDSSMAGIFWTLLTGGRLVLFHKSLITNICKLVKLIKHQKISHILCPPSFYQHILDQIASLTPIPSLTDTIIAGEIFPNSLAHQHKQILPNTNLYNEYGPTECTIWSSVAKVYDKTHHNHIGKVTIGKPIPNVQIYLLNLSSTKLITSPNQIGEIHIGGIGLAEGYLNNPKLTQEKFIQNPFSEDPNDRLYKTGDLGRWLADGNLEFIGRIDNQVKIRGFRIEPEEIEYQLMQLPEIEHAVVVPKKEKSNTFLAAYLKVQHATFDFNQALNQLKLVLPDYMIPSMFFKIDQIPLTSHGKVDRKALIKSKHDQHILKTTLYSEAKTLAEKKLLTIWEKIGLSKGKIGIDDQFFQLGGHSLLAIQLIFHIQNDFSIQLTIEEIFKSPTIRSLARLLRKKRKQKKIAPITIQNSVTNTYPLSSSQYQVWLHAKMAWDLPLFNEQFFIKIPHQININALEKAINYLLARHTILRANFVEQNEKIFQKIHSFKNIELDYIDLRTLPKQRRKKAAIQLGNQQAKKLFDLSKDLLNRFLLIQLDNEKYWLSITMHHLIMDTVASSQIIKQELETAYLAFSQEQEPALPPIKTHYTDYAVWHNKMRPKRKDIAYWKKEVQDLPNLVLSAVYESDTISHFKGKRIRFAFPKTLTQQVKSLAKNTNSSYFTVLLTAFNLLVYRYTQQNDITIGSIVSERNHPNTQTMIGNFLNTIIFRNSFSSTISFFHLLEQIKQSTIKAYEHQSVSFDWILQRTLFKNKNHPIQISFVMEPKQTESSQGWIIDQQQTDKGISLYDLSIDLDEFDGKLTGFIEYKTDLFNTIYIKNLIGHFRYLLEQIVQSPNLPIHQYHLLTPKEQSTTLIQWNQTQVNPIKKTIVELFREQVLQNPDKVAVLFEDKQLTYQELDQRASQLAYYLKTHNQIDHRHHVAICINRSLEMIVGILGILKVGAAYVPIDPTDPDIRIKQILEDSGAKVLLTQSELLKLTSFFKQPVIALDQSPDVWQQTNIPTLTYPSLHDAAYIIYTSGTTGSAKGILIEHQSISDRLNNLKGRYHFSISDRLLHYSSFGFDPSLEELFLPLLNGATLVIAPNYPYIDPKIFFDWICHYQITILNTVPIFLKMLLSYLKQNSVNHQLKKVLSGGDKLYLDTVINFYQTLPNTQLFNLYGPTEATIDTTIFECYPGVEKDYRDIPIGKPLPNTQVYVLDEHLDPLPVYVPGELYIGGIGLAREYLNLHELTAERFIPNPFSENPNDRLYKTGDLVKWLPDGNLAFIGRKDFQIKIRGYRVEAFEIEQTILKHEAVNQTVVLAQDHPKTQEKQLVAYFVLNTDEVACDAIPKIRLFLTKNLPHYSIPSVLIPIEKLPLLPSGKVDRQALIHGHHDYCVHSREHVSPKTPIQKQLAKIWGKILKTKVANIGIQDNFFEIGGNSITAIQTVSAIRHTFGTEIPVCKIYHQPTIETFAEFLEGVIGFA